MGKKNSDCMENYKSAHRSDSVEKLDLSPTEISDLFLPENNIVPVDTIPAAGSGNSPDGEEWLNPSGNQLIRSCNRKQKKLDPQDALGMAATHVAVTNATWTEIMEYEKLHRCENVRLARFRGLDGKYSPKARFLHLFGCPLPFDRHDWTVDRCGKEVRYVIDYYSQMQSLATWSSLSTPDQL
ncbi:hypothetical protein MHBO_003536 [Bonamia ostreae]|uniref:Holocytochrome c-type synthase n=1 Tax=Bonamia ostreae TaxID=126728 RepID=A0ABV2AQR9_9EUKA